MSLVNLREYQSSLETELSTLTEQLHTLAIFHADTGDWELAATADESSSTDDNVHADANEEAAEREATLASLETRYRNIVRALGKITAGTYGTCEVCQEPIEEPRLVANKAARTCMLHINEEGRLAL